MKKTLLAAIICAMAATGVVFGQTTTTISYTGPGSWNPGTQVTLSLNGTWTGYSSVGYSLWMEVPTALAPFLTIASEAYFAWTDPNQSGANTPFDGGTAQGARNGYMIEQRDLGATSNFTNGVPDTLLPPGTYHLNDLTFGLASGASTLIGQSFTMFVGTHNPRASAGVQYPSFDDALISESPFVITIVPEPSTLALLGLAAVGAGVAVYRRRKA